MKEVWKDIEGYEGLYQISNLGLVKSVSRKIKTKLGFKTTKDILLKFGKCSFNYIQVSLCKNGVQKTFKVHRLVAIHFIPNEFDKKEVNHIDGDKSNNTIDNLEWATRSENQFHAYKIGLRDPKSYKRSRRSGSSCSLSKPVLQFDMNGTFIKEHESTRLAESELGLRNIYLSANLKRKHIGGFIWRYK